MNEQVLVYEVKSSASSNADKLFSPDRKYFYWNDTFFKKINVGDYVFVVNTRARLVLFTKLDAIDIPVQTDENRTFFEDINNSYEVSGKFGKFIRLLIIAEYSTPANWKWRSLGTGEITYLNGPNINAYRSDNRIQNIYQLKELSNDQLFISVLDACIGNFTKRVWFVTQGETFTQEQGMKFLWAPIRGKDQGERFYWNNVLKVTKGDIIFNYSGGSIRAVSIATSNGYRADNPYPSSTWGKEGYKVDIDITMLDPVVSNNEIYERKNDFEASLSRISNKPLNKEGKVNQGYLYEFSKEAGSLVRAMYGKKFGKKEIDEFFDNTSIKEEGFINNDVMHDPKETINHIYDYMRSLGFRYQREEIANFYLALRTKPFVILAGISGTGKTQLPRKFAEALGFSKDQVIQLPVRPDWTDSSDLLGYTSLADDFVPKELTLAILKAKRNPSKPYFFILDEMNLARVEHYFSDFLSIIETRERDGKEIKTEAFLKEEVISKAKNGKEFNSITWPQNLYLIGTVNMDETTHAFSRKVLDRANSIEMNDIDLDWIKPGLAIEKMSNVSNSFFETIFLSSLELTEEDKTNFEENLDLLKKINEVLKVADLHFAYRVRDEVAFYLTINRKYDLMDANNALDFQIVQKILPRIHGSSERIQTVLVELLRLLEGAKISAINFDISEVNDFMRRKGELKYRRASNKIAFMLRRYDEDRFTSFWL